MPHHHHFISSDPISRVPEPLPYRVMIATPTTRGLVPSYALSLAATVETLIHFGCRFNYQIIDGDCHVDDARNLSIRNFLETDCTDLFFIDSDMGWQPRDFMRLLQVPGDIVAGVYRHKNDTETYPFHPGYPERQANEHGLYSMPKVATGFMRIRRPVLEALFEFEKKRGRVMWPKAEQASQNGRPVPRIVERAFRSDLPFELSEENLESNYHSGDYVLCLKAKHLGFSIFADIEMPFDHVGDKIWSGHLGNYLRHTQNVDHPDFERAMLAVKNGTAVDKDFETIVNASGNASYTMPASSLATCYREAKNAQGDILECGTGLSTIVMGLALAGTDHRIYALEHDLAWLRKTTAWLQRYDVTNINLIYAPLFPHENGDWYGVRADELPSQFDIAVIDGPPRWLAERTVITDVLDETLAQTRLWIVDDAQDDPIKSFVQETESTRDIELLDPGTDGKHLLALARLKAGVTTADLSSAA